MATKVFNPLLTSLPLLLTRRRFRLRTFCTGNSPLRLQSKYLETFREEFEVGNRLTSFETGKIARFANGAVVMGVNETKVLSTVASAKADGVRDFLPLTVCAQFPFSNAINVQMIGNSN